MEEIKKVLMSETYITRQHFFCSRLLFCNHILIEKK